MGHALCFKLRRITDYYAIHGCCSFCFYKRSFSYSEQCLQGLKPELRSTRTYQNTPLHLDIPSPHVRLRPRTHRIACFARPARTARRCPLGCPLTPSTRKRARQWRMPLRANEVWSEGSETDIRRWDAPSSILISDCAVTACFFPRFLTYGVKPSKSDRGFMFAQMVSVACSSVRMRRSKTHTRLAEPHEVAHFARLLAASPACDGGDREAHELTRQVRNAQ